MKLPKGRIRNLLIYTLPSNGDLITDNKKEVEVKNMELIRHTWNILAEKREKGKFFLKLSCKNDRNFFAWVVSDFSKDLSAFFFSEKQSKDSSRSRNQLAKRHGFTSENLAHWPSFTSGTARPTTQPHSSTEANLQQNI